MTRTWTARKALPGDADLIARHGCYREEDAPRRAGYADWVKPRIGARKYLGLLAVQGDEVLGGAGLVLLDWGPTRANPGGQMGRIVNVFVEEGARRQGIARELIGALMAQGEALGVREFNLGATPEGLALYESLGFAAYAPEMRRRVALAVD